MVFAVERIEGFIVTAVQIIGIIMLILYSLRLLEQQGVDPDVGALVGDAFDIGENIEKNDASMHTAGAVVEAFNVIGTKL